MAADDYKAKTNGNGNGNDPFIEQLKRDAQAILDAEDDSSQPSPDEAKKMRMLALTVLLTISIKSQMVTRSECQKNHRSWFNWRYVAMAFPGVPPFIWMIMKLTGLVSGSGGL